MIMKQIEVMFERYLNNKKPLKSKWQIIKNNDTLEFYHYHHLIMIYDIILKETKYEWYECRTDKRGLDSIKQYIKENNI